MGGRGGANRSAKREVGGGSGTTAWTICEARPRPPARGAFAGAATLGGAAATKAGAVTTATAASGICFGELETFNGGAVLTAGLTTGLGDDFEIGVALALPADPNGALTADLAAGLGSNLVADLPTALAADLAGSFAPSVEAGLPAGLAGGLAAFLDAVAIGLITDLAADLVAALSTLAGLDAAFEGLVGNLDGSFATTFVLAAGAADFPVAAFFAT